MKCNFCPKNAKNDKKCQLNDVITCFFFYKHDNYKHDKAQIQPKWIYQITISPKI